MQSNTNPPPKPVSAQSGTGFQLSRLPQRLFDEARLVCTATWRQTRRLLLLWKASGRVRRTRKAVTQALKAFGEQLHPWERGDEALRRRIAGLDREIARSRSEGQPVQRLESERDALFVELAARFMSEGGVAPGLDSKREAVEKAQAAYARHERLRSKLRGRCAPADRPTRIRVGAGYAVVGAVLLMLCSSAAGPSLPWRSLSILPGFAGRAQAQAQVAELRRDAAQAVQSYSEEARKRNEETAKRTAIAKAGKAAKTAKFEREWESYRRRVARKKARNVAADSNARRDNLGDDPAAHERPISDHGGAPGVDDEGQEQWDFRVTVDSMHPGYPLYGLKQVRVKTDIDSLSSTILDEDTIARMLKQTLERERISVLTEAQWAAISQKDCVDYPVVELKVTTKRQGAALLYAVTISHHEFVKPLFDPRRLVHGITYSSGCSGFSSMGSACESMLDAISETALAVYRKDIRLAKKLPPPPKTKRYAVNEAEKEALVRYITTNGQLPIVSKVSECVFDENCVMVDRQGFSRARIARAIKSGLPADVRVKTMQDAMRAVRNGTVPRTVGVTIGMYNSEKGTFGLQFRLNVNEMVIVPRRNYIVNASTYSLTLQSMCRPSQVEGMLLNDCKRVTAAASREYFNIE